MSQVLWQKSDTHQYAKSKAKSVQVIPVNVNLPVNGGVVDGPDGAGKPCGCDGQWKDHESDADVKQTNDASAESKAKNESFTGQTAWQRQDVQTSPGFGGSSEPSPCGCNDQWKHGGGGDVSQQLGQDSDTRQKAESEATSHQFVPVNVNLPISILSSGSNNGDVQQTNDASTESHAGNESFTGQAASQDQGVTTSSNGGGGGDVDQRGSQDSDTSQKADSKAESYQVVPINVNAPISILSSGSNNGDVHQTNDASADSSASNHAGTLQIAGQSQQVSPITT